MALAVAAAGPVGAPRAADRASACPQIAFAGGPAVQGGAVVYRIEIDAAPTSCTAARRVLRLAIDRPTFAGGPTASVDGWRCELWHGDEPWALACSHGGVIVRAYGPTSSDDPWLLAAVRGTMPVLEPEGARALGFRLERVSTKTFCANTVPQHDLTAWFERPDGATIQLAEERPTCGNIGLDTLLGRWRIHGAPAVLVEACGWVGCSRTSGAYALHWRERGDDVVLFTHGVDQTTLLAFARSVAVVAH